MSTAGVMAHVRSGSMTSPSTLTIATPLGPVEIYGSPKGVCAIRFARPWSGSEDGGASGHWPPDGHPSPAAPSGDEPAAGHRFPEEVLAPVQTAAAQLAAYFAGRLQQFDFPLDLQGTPFQLAVWRTLLTIPFGATRSYGWVASAVGRPGGARAVGQAVGANPVAIVVPCHRVIAADGSLGGYTGGLDVKRFLLRLERRGELAS